ncbi:DUF4252 domain-containing protein [Proteiniphilum acetatigenes]|uniref:DUF4252 domain-containing protein n=1 Tax=Proteiniphilum acetatigenes TaxID=294710 RepID=UPI0008E5AAA6|nr:DUF4252 domain-containing protein [Proteiniphilum acetatigenes]SFL20595.1 protein of unknown function [Porphyromonadaceae bacterium KH3CP3RA]
MRIVMVMLFSLLLPAALLADNFVSVFMERCAEDERLLNNVNIGKTMLDRMAANTDDEELKSTFKELNSIRIISSDNVEDSKYYFKKANELIKESFMDYEEVVSLSEIGSKISVWVKRQGEEKQDLILIALDSDGKLSIITVSGKIDFDSISKLSGSLRDGQQFP